MAIGDRWVSLAAVLIEPKVGARVEYRYWVEAKVADPSDGRGNTLDMSWAEFTAVLSPDEKAALRSMLAKMMSCVKEKVPMLADALEERS